jgi:hypothetical protein
MVILKIVLTNIGKCCYAKCRYTECRGAILICQPWNVDKANIVSDLLPMLQYFLFNTHALAK